MSTFAVQLRRLFFNNSFKYLFTVKLLTQFMCKKLSVSPLENSLMVSISVLSCWLLLTCSLICPISPIATSKYTGKLIKEKENLSSPLELQQHTPLLFCISLTNFCHFSSFYFLLNVCFTHRFCYHKKICIWELCTRTTAIFSTLE